MKTKFIGTGVAMITPFNENKQIDFPAFAKLINDLIAGGVDYLLVMGTTAESACLSEKEKTKILEFAKKEINSRVPIMYGIGGNDTAEIINRIKTASLNGVDGILSVAPYYNKPNQEGLYQHFAQIAKASPIQIILYNVPGRTGVNILPETVAKLAKDFDNITAIKEASGSIEQMMKVIKLTPESFTVISGDDALTLPLIALGGEGVISVAANVFPKEMSQLVKFALHKDFDNAKPIHYKLLDSISNMFAEGNPCGAKEYLAQQNRIKNELRLPMVPASKILSEKIKNDLMRY